MPVGLTGRSMSSLQEKWKQLDPLLDEALSLEPEDQERFLADLTTRDPELAQGLSRLLAGAASPSPWLERGAAIGEELLEALAETTDDQVRGRRVGPFELIREIGQGGMAQVFLARRADGLYEQQVAMKMMWQGMRREDLLNRFDRERQILAHLNDPHIASLLDGGVTEDGRPWLAMEYVAGEPIDRYCEQQHLDLPQRLALVADVAGAVAAAHRRDIIHRDIKPSNVLVDGEGQVKLVDFGIAKLLDDGPDAATVTEARLLTPEYASPEQIEGEVLGRPSDVYQLGLLLFELTTGQRPFSREGASPLTFQRRIVEQVPPTPSRAATRGSGLRLDRDLDAIILKCLEKRPSDRYVTVEELTQDLRSYRLGLPLIASSDQHWHRLQKFVARHRLGVSVAVLFAGLLLAYAGTVTWQSKRIAEQRDAARLETAKAQEISGFLQELFSNASPEVSLGQELTIKEMVDQGSVVLEGRLADQPVLKAEMLDNLGGIYHSLAEYPAAIDHFQRSLALKDQAGASAASVAATLRQLGNSQRGAGEFTAALDNLGRALTIARDSAGFDPLALAKIYSSLGVTYSELRDNAKSGEFHRQALELRSQLLPADDLALALSKADYGVVLHKQARRAEAGELYREAAAIQEAGLGPTHPRTLTTLRNLAVLEIGLGNLTESERLLRQVRDREREIYRGDHPKMAWTLGYLGRVARDLGQLDRAESYWRETVRVLSSTLPDNHLHTAGASHELGKILLANGKSVEGCKRIAATMALRLELRGEDSVSSNQSRFHLGRCRVLEGKIAEGKALMEAAQPYLKETDDYELLMSSLAKLEG